MLLPPIAATLLLLALALLPLWLSERVTNKVPAGGANKTDLASAGCLLLWTTQGRTAYAGNCTCLEGNKMWGKT
jgi:hypothetical protein